MMSKIHDFFAMDGYGIYVWPCYVAWGILVVSHVISSLRRKNKLHTALRRKSQIATVTDNA